MKTTINRLYEAKPALDRLFNSEVSNIKSAYALGKIARKLRDEFADIEQQRVKLVESMSSKNEDGTAMTEPSEIINPKTGQPDLKYKIENQEELDKKFEEFKQMEIEIDIWPITLEMIEEIKLSGGDMDMLLDFIKVENE